MHYLELIEQHLNSQGWKYDPHIDDDAKARKEGTRTWELKDHVRAMIYSMLSNQRPWVQIMKKTAEIDDIFFHYDIAKIKAQTPKYFIDSITGIQCGNMSIENQMESLIPNIELMERIAAEFGSMDDFIAKQMTLRKAVSKLSTAHSKYKLGSMAEALVWEYIRNVGYDGAKPDTHIRRFLGQGRMGASRHEEASISEALDQIDVLAAEVKKSRAWVDSVIWTFCANSEEAYGQVCTANVDVLTCAQCPVKTYCNHSGYKEFDPSISIPDYIAKITTILGKPIDKDSIKVIDRGVPHVQPASLPSGYMAVYTFIYKDEFLKIGVVGPNSGPRYTSQHYRLPSGTGQSTLAKSILNDEAMKQFGLTDATVGNWIKENCRRIDFEIPAASGIFARDLIEKILHYKYNPRYEGFKSQR